MVKSANFAGVPSFFDLWMQYNGRNIEAVQDKRWICLYTDQEEAIALYCANRAIPFFLPLLRTDHNKLIVLWSQYIFCQPNIDQEVMLRQSSRVLQCLVPYDEESLISHLKGIAPINKFSTGNLETGDVVTVKKGNLAGVAATVTQVSNDSQQVTLSVNMLGKEVRFKKRRSEIKLETAPRKGGLSILPDYWHPPEELPKDNQFDIRLAEINEELVKYLSSHPNLIYDLSPRRFEMLVAEILSDMGFEIRLTPETRDGGRDIFAVFKLPIGEILTIVECKRYKPDNKIGVDIIERFLYTLDRKDNASCGLIATTSFFTSEARGIEKGFPWKLKLKDFSALKEWTSQYGTWKKNTDSGLWVPKTLF